MRKLISLILVLSLILTLCSCGKYVSSYQAIGLVRNQTSHSCNASFHSLNGQLVFKLKRSEKGTEGNISYLVQVEKGEICLSYDIYGTKEELTRVKEGESVEDRGGYVEGGFTVYIIIEAEKNSKGKISVELDN